MSDWPVPYIAFNGNCEEAVKFYQRVLGGEVQIMHFGDTPPNPAFPAMPENMTNLVLHPELKRGDHLLYFSDSMPNAPVTAGNNISLAIQCDTKEETNAVFQALSEGGNIDMDLQETFFAPLYGKLTDKFGILWQIICRPQQ